MRSARGFAGPRAAWCGRELKNGGGSYLSSHDPREVLGVGPAAKIDWVEITWPKPSGKVQRIVNPPMNRYIDGFGKVA